MTILIHKKSPIWDEPSAHSLLLMAEDPIFTQSQKDSRELEFYRRDIASVYFRMGADKVNELYRTCRALPREDMFDIFQLISKIEVDKKVTSQMQRVYAEKWVQLEEREAIKEHSSDVFNIVSLRERKTLKRVIAFREALSAEIIECAVKNLPEAETSEVEQVSIFNLLLLSIRALFLSNESELYLDEGYSSQQVLDKAKELISYHPKTKGE